jgi:hypothetical protein
MSALVDHIRQFVPGADGEDLEHREALVVARDYAAYLRSRVRSELAVMLAAEAQDIASTYAVADVSCDELKNVTDYCRNLVHCAFKAEWYDREVPT